MCNFVNFNCVTLFSSVEHRVFFFFLLKESVPRGLVNDVFLLLLFGVEQFHFVIIFSRFIKISQINV